MRTHLKNIPINLNNFPGKADTIQVTPPASHAHCMVCGGDRSLGLRFTPDGRNAVIATIHANTDWQGYAGIMHGGMVSTLLDAAMTHCLFHHGVHAMTASLKVRFLSPVPCVGQIKVRATLSDRRHRIFSLNAEMLSSGRVLARAEARFIKSSDALIPNNMERHDHLG